MAESRIVVVGGGAAGGAAARRLATLAAERNRRVEVVVVGREERRPYNRTTVNKGLLTGAVGDDDIGVPDLDHQDVTWRLRTHVTSVDAAARTVVLGDGTSLGADAVVIATGAAPRPLPVTVGPGVADRVVHLRTPADTARLRALAGDGPVVVAGAGLIGSEMPGSLAGLTSSVSLLDPAPYPLHRQVGPVVGRWIADAHARDGVDVRMGRTITAVAASDRPAAGGRALAVELDDGEVLHAAAVLACLGVLPDTAWLAGSGIDLHRPTMGVAVDRWQRVPGMTGVYAAGDVAAVPGPDGQQVRIEHWGAAIDQGRRAGHSVAVDLGLLGGSDHDPEPSPLPSYSTYVGDTKLTVLGWNPPGCVEHVVLGAPGEARFLVAHVLADRVVGAVGVGGARAANRIRPLVEAGATLPQVQEALDAMVTSRTS